MLGVQQVVDALWLQKVEFVWVHLQAAPGWHLGQPDKQPAAAVVCVTIISTHDAARHAAAPLPRCWCCAVLAAAKAGRGGLVVWAHVWEEWVAARILQLCTRGLTLRSDHVELNLCVLVCVCVCDCHCPKPGRCSGTPNTAAPAAVCRGQQTLTI